MANRKQRAARRLEEQVEEQVQEQPSTRAEKEPASLPAGKPKSARKMFLILWGIPLVLFIIVAILKG